MDQTVPGAASVSKEPEESGHYAKKQILSKDRLIAWSHRRRFETGLRLARTLGARRVLDYGCGDGTFLSMLARAGALVEGVGAEVDARVVEDCRMRLSQTHEGLRFVLAEELAAPEHEGLYELVVCMEVLEHIVEVDEFIKRLARLTARRGHLLCSVPVETGLPLLFKQMVRRVAGWRGIGDYPGTSSYTFGELMRGVTARRQQHIARPVITSADGREFHDHKGFNWMRLRDRLSEHFQIERTFGSPVTWLPTHLCSQAWFVARKV